MQVTVNGKATRLAEGHEFFGPYAAAAGVESVPANAISGFIVPGPDGMITTYYALDGGRDVMIYRLEYAPIPAEEMVPGGDRGPAPELLIRIPK